MSSVLDEVVEGLEPIPELLSVMVAREPAAVLALDIGTSGVRAALFDEHGREIEGAHARTNRVFSSFADVEELDARDLIELVDLTVDQLFEKVSQNINRVETVAICCFWHSLMGVGADGQPTTPVFGWASTRAGSAADQLRLRLDDHAVHARTGCRIHPSYWPAKLLWLKEERRDAAEITKRWMSFAEYLLLRMFGDTATSVSMASGTGLMDQRSCLWDDEILDVLDLPVESLPEISAPGRSFSGLKADYASRFPQLSEARVLPPIGDGAADNIGSGCTTREKAALMIGTSGAMRVMYEGEPLNDVPPELWSYRADRTRVLVGGALSDGGGLYGWMRQSLAFTGQSENIERALAEIEPDSHGLTILPFWAGERSSGWSTAAHGAMLGLTHKTHPIEILRAAMEAVAYRFVPIAEALDKIATSTRVIASGNALRLSPVWMQIIADVLGRPVTLCGLREPATRGAALLALEATGKIESIEESATADEQTFVPDPARQARYREGLERQKKFYDQFVSRAV